MAQSGIQRAAECSALCPTRRPTESYFKSTISAAFTLIGGQDENSILSLALVVALLCPFASAKSRLPNSGSVVVYTDIPAGPVSGIWTRAGSPYHVTGEITVPNDSTLLIEPGVEVIFYGASQVECPGQAAGSRHTTGYDTIQGWGSTGWLARHTVPEHGKDK